MGRTAVQLAEEFKVTPMRISQVVKEAGFDPPPKRIGNTYQFNASEARKIKRRIKRVTKGEAK